MWIILFAPGPVDDVTGQTDMELLQELNARFISNYINQDTIRHNEIIGLDFVCIDNSGKVLNRKGYMKNWATSYQSGGFTSFGYTDEFIRIFGNVALVRSRSTYTRIEEGKSISGSSVYTDTYVKTNGRWWCVQAQITPVQ